MAAELREIRPARHGARLPRDAGAPTRITWRKPRSSSASTRSSAPRATGSSAIFEDDPAHALAVAGFRVGHMLMWGRFLYVDDLSTLPEARRRGYGRQLLDWLGDEAERLGCEQFHLDSGVGPTRTDAHRLYFNTGLEITSFHFARRLDH